VLANVVLVVAGAVVAGAGAVVVVAGAVVVDAAPVPALMTAEVARGTVPVVVTAGGVLVLVGTLLAVVVTGVVTGVIVREGTVVVFTVVVVTAPAEVTRERSSDRLRTRSRAAWYELSSIPCLRYTTFDASSSEGLSVVRSTTEGWNQSIPPGRPWKIAT